MRRCDAIDGQSCARIPPSTKTAAGPRPERAEETERRQKRLIAANDQWRANRMLRYRRKLESHLAHAHITRVGVRDAAESWAEFAGKLATAAGEAETRGEEQRVDERRGRWGGERRNEGEGLGSEAANEGTGGFYAV